MKKEIVDFVTDEGPRAGTTAESLAKLKCCSGKEGGLVTAGTLPVLMMVQQQSLL